MGLLEEADAVAAASRAKSALAAQVAAEKALSDAVFEQRALELGIEVVGALRALGVQPRETIVQVALHQAHPVRPYLSEHLGWFARSRGPRVGFGLLESGEVLPVSRRGTAHELFHASHVQDARGARQPLSRGWDDATLLQARTAFVNLIAGYR